MARPNHGTATTNVASVMKSVTNPTNPQNDTHEIPSSGVHTMITPVGSTNPAQVSSPSHIAAWTVAPASQAIPTLGSSSTQGIWNPGTISHRTMPYGMPSSLMQGIQTSASTFS